MKENIELFIATLPALLCIIIGGLLLFSGNSGDMLVVFMAAPLFLVGIVFSLESAGE